MRDPCCQLRRITQSQYGMPPFLCPIFRSVGIALVPGARAIRKLGEGRVSLENPRLDSNLISKDLDEYQ
jgi:hypothetical protein